MDVLGDIEWYRGDSYRLPITLLNKAGGALNLTGSSFLFTVNSNERPSDTSTQMFQVIGVVDDPLTGEVYFIPTEDQTNIASGTYYYDIQMAQGTNRRTLSKNKFKILQDITKADYSGTVLLESGEALWTEDNRILVLEG